MPVQPPEHYPHRQRIGVKTRSGKPGLEKGTHACLWRFPGPRHGSLHPDDQRGVDVAVSGCDQLVLVREVMVDQPDRYPGLRADGADGEPVVAVTLEALDSGFNQRLTAHRGWLPCKARFERGSRHSGHASQAPAAKVGKHLRAALCPGAPVTPPPGCVPALHMYIPL